MKKPVQAVVLKTLKMNGKPIDWCAPSPAQQRLIDGLSRLPNDEVFTTHGACEKLGVTLGAFQNAVAGSKAFDHFKIRDGKNWIWGSPEALAEYQRQAAANRGEL